jgi:hypothetical protein
VERQDEWLNDELLLHRIPAEIRIGGPPCCPLCGTPVQSLRFIRQISGAVTLAWQCPHCSIGGLISISLTPLPEDNHAVLTSMEQIAFAELPPISEADARRMRQLIWAHQGDLRDLL